MDHPLTVTLSKNRQPVTDLQPYLDSYLVVLEGGRITELARTRT